LSSRSRLAAPSGPGSEETCSGTPLTGRDDLGEATYAQMIDRGEEIIAGKNEHFRVVDVVPFEEEDESPFVGLLQVEAV